MPRFSSRTTGSSTSFSPSPAACAGSRRITRRITATGPRASAFAYALDGHKDKKQAKTVLRGGYGFFYDRFGAGSLMSLEQFNDSGNSQTQISIANPTCFDATT